MQTLLLSACPTSLEFINAPRIILDVFENTVTVINIKLCQMCVVSAKYHNVQSVPKSI